MLEIELKFRCPDPAGVETRLTALGFGPATVTAERDHYVNAPDRDYAVTGEAFRVRRVGETNAFTYKGPKRAGATAKIRTEIELAIAEGDAGFDAAQGILTGLGYRPVAVVRKTRSSRTSTTASRSRSASTTAKPWAGSPRWKSSPKRSTASGPKRSCGPWRRTSG